MKHICTYNLLQ